MRIKVLMVIGNLSKGGAERQCRLLANHLDPSIFEISIIFFHEGLSHDLDRKIKVVPVERGLKWGLVSLYKRIENAIRQIEPDLLHVWLPEIITLPAVVAAWKMDIPIVSSHRVSLKYSGSALKVLRDHLGLCAHFLSRCIVSNYAVKKEPFYFREIYEKHSGVEIPNGLDLDQFSDIPSKLTSDASSIQLLYAGRISPEKGIVFLIELIREMVYVRNLPVQLIIFGTGPEGYYNEILLLVRKYRLEDIIHFKGDRSDWFRVSNRVDALLFPSTSEGTSNVVLEALAVGIPIVIAESDMAFNLVENYKSALVVEPRSIDVWCTNIMKLVETNELRVQLITSGYAVANKFSIDRMTSKFKKVYESVLN